MALIRPSSQQGFKPIPEDAVYTLPPLPRNNSSTSAVPDSAMDTGHDKSRSMQNSPSQNGAATPEANILELRKLLTDLHEDGGGGDGVFVSGGGGSRPSSRCGMKSKFSSRRGSWVPNEEEETEADQVTPSQKAHLLVVSQQRLVYTLQGLRHELSSLDEEVNRIRNDILNSRRFYNAMRGVHEQPTWGSGWRRNYGSGSSSPSMHSLDNSYSDDTDSLARSESCCSFASWRSEAELFNVFREVEETMTSDKSSSKSSTSTNVQSDTSNSNDTGRHSSCSASSHGSNPANRDNNIQNSGGPVIRGRYRQLGTSHGTPRR